MMRQLDKAPSRKGRSGIKKQQKGLSLILMVFIIVALSVLAAALVQILTASSESVAREVLSARAFMAAESGGQRLLNDIYSGDESNCASAPNTVETTPYTFTAFEGCGTVSVDCSYVNIGTDIFYAIESAGVCGPASEQASRTIEVQAKNI